MKCVKCGAEIGENFKFCLKCGTKIENGDVPIADTSASDGSESSSPCPKQDVEASRQYDISGMGKAQALVEPKATATGDSSANLLRGMGQIQVSLGWFFSIGGLVLWLIGVMCNNLVATGVGLISLLIGILTVWQGAKLKAQGKAAVRADQNYQLLQAAQERLMRIEGQQILGQMSQASSAITNAAGGVPPATQSLIVCKNCGSTISSHTKFCPECGASLVRKCTSCGTEFKPGMKFCPECGAKV